MEVTLKHKSIGSFSSFFSWLVEQGRKTWVCFFQSASMDTSDCTNAQVERILRLYGNGILRLAYSYLHNQSDAQDILQDTCLQFLKVTPTFENETHEKAWFFRVAANLSKNRIDYNKVRETDELKEELASSNRKDLSFVWDAVQQLPVAYREVIHLFYQEGYSTAEIAKIVDEKESTVRSNLHRGREKLKEVLKEVYDFDETI